jgi:hypothetical protein
MLSVGCATAVMRMPPDVGQLGGRIAPNSQSSPEWTRLEDGVPIHVIDPNHQSQIKRA